MKGKGQEGNLTNNVGKEEAKNLSVNFLGQMPIRWMPGILSLIR